MDSSMKLRTRLLIFICLLSASSLCFAANMQFSKNVKENQFKNITQAIQIGLIEAGYDPGVPDGYVGPRTSAAIKSFQRDHKLKITGTPDKTALRAIKNALASDE